MPAAEVTPRMIAGSRNCTTKVAGLVENGTNCVRGVQPHQIAGKRVTRIAMTKAGTDSPSTAALRAKKSSTPSWRTAAITPIGTPMATATASARPPSVALTGSRRASSLITGWRVHSDSPRLPRTTAPSQSTYCTGIGRFRPSLARRSSRSLP